MKIPAATNRSRLTLLVLVAIGALAAATTCAAFSIPKEAEGADHLRQLMASISEERRPSAELVLEAYNEYVRLHEKLQLQLDLFEESGGKLTDPAADKTTREVRAILGQPEMQLIAQNIFFCLRREDDVAHYERSMTPELAKTIESAVNAFFG